jgi:uncharacterized protein (UPF0305 family)
MTDDRQTVKNSIKNIHKRNIQEEEDTDIHREGEDSISLNLEPREEMYDPKENYYVKYWELWKENEITVAKIKEKSYEIELMTKHLESMKENQD